jgi:hypothetical protein
MMTLVASPLTREEVVLYEKGGAGRREDEKE